MGELSAHDYERMLDLAVAVIENPSPQAVWHLVGEELVTGLDATTAIFVELHHRRRTGRAEGWAPQWVGGTPLEDLVHRRMRQRHPLFVYVSHGELRPTTVDETADRTQWRRSDCFSEAYEIYGTTRQMVLPLFVSADVIRGFILGRPGQDFSTRRLAFARRVQPLLHAADRHLEALRHTAAPSQDADPDARARAAAVHGITPRELAVLGLLADGLTALSIARRLAISPHTVNRHLEKIYRKLDTRDRLTTVLLARKLGLVRG
ncbi:helix-turn-helix transcriptional regulator [Streptomyces sp. NBC_01275]|uniref:helix-turn-helix transcriptional regulator n=1 Tax=Streptomyces sp. NBC_01275 TaxID=2903807 RepID=UPI002251B89B|nr:helix-turn-helix transcriptional regulator [Streptomyces sp. NBC_01275]MCX4767671.1 helix-turn-helix transcriptional regulator [Streptomyces sp. NBC_01275]